MKNSLTELLTKQRLIGLAVFAFTLAVFLVSHVHQVTDSRYSMLVSESLVSRGSFTLDVYRIPRYPPVWGGYYFRNGPVYQIEVANGHLYHHSPPGTAVLSAPYVAVMKIFGVSSSTADGAYDERGDVRLQASLAALLMALLAAIFFATARLLLPNIWSVVVAIGGALGTQVYSTASRALWSETWGILLLGLVVYCLLAAEVRKREPGPLLLATLLSWSYFVRPTFAIHIVAITVYVLIFYRRIFLRYALTGAAWLAGFLIYSWIHFHQLLPTYYRASRLTFDKFWIALAGNLISPARGLLVYVPVLFFVGYLLVRYRRQVFCSRLAWLSLTIVAGQLFAVAGFTHWWGGHSFGPRLTTGAVPWLVLPGILGVAAMLKWRAQREAEGKFSKTAWRIQVAGGALFLLLSMFINTVGATSHATWLWNLRPQEIDRHPERLWDWRQPQFLAKYLPYPPPNEFPVIGQARIEFNSPAAEKFLWYGWMQDAAGGVWSDSNAAIVFSPPEKKSYLLRIQMAPFIVPGKLNQQRINFTLNDQRVSTMTLNDPQMQTYTITLPAEFVRDKNVLKLESPDAQSPQKVGTGDDPRPRAINVAWIEFANQDLR